MFNPQQLIEILHSQHLIPRIQDFVCKILSKKVIEASGKKQGQQMSLHKHYVGLNLCSIIFTFYLTPVSLRASQCHFSELLNDPKSTPELLTERNQQHKMAWKLYDHNKGLKNSTPPVKTRSTPCRVKDGPSPDPGRPKT